MTSTPQKITSTPSLSSVTSSTTSALDYDWGLSNDMKQLLLCPACGEIAIPPIVLCAKGHMICHICREKVTKCPSCNSEYTNTRNDLAESILANCTFRCPYANQGCMEVLKGSEASAHIKECDYRPIVCKVFTDKGKPCEKVIDYNDHIHHMRNDHGVMGVDGTSTLIDMSTSVKLGQGNWTFPSHYMNTFGHTFWCNLHASYNVLIAWVSINATSKESEKYAAAITIFDPVRKWQQAKWIGKVHSIRTVARDVYNSGNCLALLPESFILLSTIKIDEAGRKIKQWRCHFEIIEIDYPNQQLSSNQNPGETTSIDSSDEEEPVEPKAPDIRGEFWASRHVGGTESIQDTKEVSTGASLQSFKGRRSDYSDVAGVVKSDKGRRSDTDLSLQADKGRRSKIVTRLYPEPDQEKSLEEEDNSSGSHEEIK